MSRIHRIDTPADRPDEILALTRDPVVVVPFDELLEELETLRRALGIKKSTPEIDDAEEEEWADVMTDLGAHLGPLPAPGSASAWARGSTDREVALLAARIRQAEKAIRSAEKSVDHQGSATGALLPSSHARRVETLLGYGILPLAWVRRLDVLQF